MERRSGGRGRDYSNTDPDILKIIVYHSSAIGAMKPAQELPPGSFTEGQLHALLTLLGDEDPTVWRPIRERLTSAGTPVLRWLEKHRLHSDPAIRRRVKDIFLEREATLADNEFMAFLLSHGEEFDIEQAAWLLAKTRYPEINLEGYNALLDKYAEDVRPDVEGASAGEPQLRLLNSHLFQHLGFKGNEASYYEPENSYLNKVLDRRLGIPISLCVLYLGVARRLKLPVTGVGMPGHFLCRYQTARETIFVDPFHGGKLLTTTDCMKRLQKLDVAMEETHLAPISARKILTRMIQNVHLIHRERKDRVEADRLRRYLVILGK